MESVGVKNLKYWIIKQGEWTMFDTIIQGFSTCSIFLVRKAIQKVLYKRYAVPMSIGYWCREQSNQCLQIVGHSFLALDKTIVLSLFKLIFIKPLFYVSK